MMKKQAKILPNPYWIISKLDLLLKAMSISLPQVLGLAFFQMMADDAKTLIKHADTAMYDVKDKGKNNFKLFTKEMQHHFYRKMMIEKQLRKALERDEFELYYQPIMNLKTNEIVAVESLLRWNNATLGQVPPDEFISIAEETGMIIPIGNWVLETAIDQNARWQKAGYHPFKSQH